MRLCKRNHPKDQAASKHGSVPFYYEAFMQPQKNSNGAVFELFSSDESPQESREHSETASSGVNSSIV